MDEAVYQKSTNFNLPSTESNGTDIICCKTTASDKKLRIFGFEVSPCLMDSFCSRSERHESVSDSETFMNETPEEKTSICMNSSGIIPPNPNESLRNLSVSAIMGLKYECHFCLKKFFKLTGTGRSSKCP
ncbi:hypothetical protein A4A49_16829 [Nicotiana attenuata]|uniref:Uncharacterized protein n=1 Tax=Nicotiana attenuata TaxID=49451 RepID=A0A314KJ20_NICAT|nr:hypothetical protein A4A49_16829 [Nicotiana attenuata]